MTRHFPDWIEAFQNYASFGEAPRKMYFWVGVSAIAGALRRKVWIDQHYFKWYPNFYTILVAPPGVIAKTTTADIAMDLLREVPGILFGPSVVTWQALVTSFTEACETFECIDKHGEIMQMPMSPITISSGEFGNLLNPQDKEMVDMLVNLWDGKSFQKKTKHSGDDNVVNPWINLIACTTPAWIAGNFPEYMIGGGFTSRCVFVYGEQKARFVAYPGLSVPKDIDQLKNLLIQDLSQISLMAGEYQLTKQAIEWGDEWYKKHNTTRQPHLDDSRFGGYIARKQTHIHKLAMVLAAARSDKLIITQEILETAATMVTDLEIEMAKVFQKIGQSEITATAQRLLDFIQRKGRVDYAEAYRYIHAQFPQFRDFEDMLKGLLKAGYIHYEQINPGMPNGSVTLIWPEKKDPSGPEAPGGNQPT